MGLQESSMDISSDFQRGGEDVSTPYSSQCLLSDDIWEKFDFFNARFKDENAYLSVRADADLDSATEEDFLTTIPTGIFMKEACEIRQHDCMWAGHCSSHDHRKSESRAGARTLRRLSGYQRRDDNHSGRTVTKFVNKPDSSQCFHPTSTSSVAKTGIRITRSPTRSLLIKPRLRTSTDASATAGKTTEYVIVSNDKCCAISDVDSPRPLTPQSLSESEDDDDHPRFRHKLDLGWSSAACNVDLAATQDDREFDEVEPNPSTAVSISEVTGQIFRTAAVEVTSEIVGRPCLPSFYSDHSYHLSKGSVHMDSLGVQTPSDSEEEIDVVSVTEKAPPSRIAMLPTNPSDNDRQHIQLTVASAIQKHPSVVTVPNQSGICVASGVLAASDRTLVKKTQLSCTKRRPYTSKKRTKYQHRMQQHRATVGRGKRRGALLRFACPDPGSEPCEKRSLHNNMERQRRIDLRNLIKMLRDLVPAVSRKERAAKVTILREASVYCRKLEHQHCQLLTETSQLRRRQECLRLRVSNLRRINAIAANRK